MPPESHSALLQDILQYLNAHIDGIEHIVIVRRDGTRIAHLSSAADGQIETALTEFSRIASDVCRQLEHGSNTEALIKGKQRFLALYSTRGVNTLLGIIGQSSVNLGLLNSGARSAIEKIEAIISD